MIQNKRFSKPTNQMDKLGGFSILRGTRVHGIQAPHSNSKG